MQKSEKRQEREEEALLEMERDVGERRQANESNQDNPEEVEAELRQIEVKIDTEREGSYE